jgi:dCTP deaminase
MSLLSYLRHYGMSEGLRLWLIDFLGISSASLLSHHELLELIESGVITANSSQVKGSSIDITLDDVLLLEDTPKFNAVVDLKGGESIETREFRMTESHGYQMLPGEFLLGSTVERFNLPEYLSAEYKLKSTQARNGSEHLGAGWIDPGFKGTLTLELVNCTRFHRHTLKPKMMIGQIVFFKHMPVPHHASYAAKGQYQGQSGVTAPGVLR